MERVGSSKDFGQENAPVQCYICVLSFSDVTAYFLFDLHEQYEYIRS